MLFILWCYPWNFVKWYISIYIFYSKLQFLFSSFCSDLDVISWNGIFFFILQWLEWNFMKWYIFLKLQLLLFYNDLEKLHEMVYLFLVWNYNYCLFYNGLHEISWNDIFFSILNYNSCFFCNDLDEISWNSIFFVGWNYNYCLFCNDLDFVCGEEERVINMIKDWFVHWGKGWK